MRVSAFVLFAVFLQATGIQVVVTGADGPIADAQVVVAGQTSRTGADGRVTILAMPGAVEITVVREGFNPVTLSGTVVAGRTEVITVALEPQTTMEEHARDRLRHPQR